MKKSTKVWLGIATIWPILYIFLFVTTIFLMVLLAPTGGSPGRGPGSSVIPFGFVALVAIHLITIFGHMGLTVFYIIRVFKTERLDQNLKIMWTLLLFFVGFFAQPVFWYLYIWRGLPEAVSQKPAQLGPGSQSRWSRQAAKEPEVAYVPPPQPPDWR